MKKPIEPRAPAPYYNLQPPKVKNWLSRHIGIDNMSLQEITEEFKSFSENFAVDVNDIWISTGYDGDCPELQARETDEQFEARVKEAKKLIDQYKKGQS